MLTEEKKKELLKNIEVIEEQVKCLNKEKNGYVNQLIQDAVETVRNRFSGIAEGDKVKVQYSDWDFNRSHKVYEEIFYLKGFHIPHYYYLPNIEECVQVDFFKTKKDGSKSLRTQVLNNTYIKSIEKVTE